MDLSEKQKELLAKAKDKIREAQMECEDGKHPLYSACDDIMCSISDLLEDAQ